MDESERRGLSTEETDIRDRHSKKIKQDDGVAAMDESTPNDAVVPETMEEGEVDRKYQRQHMSFRDKLMVGRQMRKGYEAVDVEATKVLADREPITVSLKGEKPSIRISENTMKRLVRPFRNSLILKLLGRSITYGVLKDRLRRVWSIPEDSYELIDLSEGYFLARFEEDEDRRFALEEGPWMVLGHYLTVREWTPGFKPSADRIHSTAVWIALPGCPLEYYDEEVLMAVGELFGRPIKVDEYTVLKKRGGFAKFCVEVDLDKPLQPKIDLNGIEQEVRYEGLNLICFACGRSGHRQEQCPYVVRCPTTDGVAAEQPPPVPAPKTVAPQQHIPGNPELGPWMLPRRKPRRTRVNAAANGGGVNGKSNPAVGSRFSALNNEDADVISNPMFDHNREQVDHSRTKPSNGNSNATNEEHVGHANMGQDVGKRATDVVTNNGSLNGQMAEENLGNPQMPNGNQFGVLGEDKVEDNDNSNVDQAYDQVEDSDTAANSTEKKVNQETNPTMGNNIGPSGLGKKKDIGPNKGSNPNLGVKSTNIKKNALQRSSPGRQALRALDTNSKAPASSQKHSPSPHSILNDPSILLQSIAAGLSKESRDVLGFGDKSFVGRTSHVSNPSPK